MALPLHSVKHRPNDLIEYATLYLRRHPRTRRERTHAAGVDAAVAVKDTLVILR